MQSHVCKKSVGLLILRLVIGWIFVYHGITKFGHIDQMSGFVWGAIQAIGLTFLSVKARLIVIASGEILAGLLFILGIFTRVASVIVLIIMIGAMHTKGRSFDLMEIDIILAGMALGLFFTKNGMYSFQRLYYQSCRGNCTPGNMTKKVKMPVAKTKKSVKK